MPTPTKTLAQGAIDPWTKPQYRGYQTHLKRQGREGKVRLDVPWEQLTDAERAVAASWLQQLDARLSARPFLFGTHTALADMAIAPFVRQFAAIDTAWWSAQPWPHLQAWLAQWQASTLLASVMHKLPAWVDGTEGVVFPAGAPPAPNN